MIKALREPNFRRGPVEKHWLTNRLSDRRSGCTEEIIGKPDGETTYHDYRRLAYSVAKQAWLIYECNYEPEGKHKQRCLHWFDDRLVRVIATTRNTEFVTCYHWHKPYAQTSDPHRAIMDMPVGDRKLALIRDTRVLKDSDLLKTHFNELQALEPSLFPKSKDDH